MRLLVGGGTLLAVAALIEWRTGTNSSTGTATCPVPALRRHRRRHIRAARLRARGSAQHPIALGAALVMLIPLAVYLYRRDDRRSGSSAAALLTLGASRTGSRTAAIMLIVAAGDLPVHQARRDGAAAADAAPAAW